MDSKLKKLITTHAQYVKNTECCGIIAFDNAFQLQVIPCENIHIDKKRFFEINPDEFLKNEKRYNILSIYHSHVETGPEPSEYDKAISDQWGLPFYIYSVKENNFFLYFPETYEPPDLLGRTYVDDLQNCFRFVIDYYQKLNALSFIDFDYALGRENGKFGEKATFTIKNFINKNNFHEVDSFQKHDLLLFRSDLYGFSHFAIYAGDDQIIHHEESKLSTTTMLTEGQIKNIFKIFRNNKFQS